MWEALREAHDEEMERDPTVCVMGERLRALQASTARCASRQRLSRPIIL